MLAQRSDFATSGNVGAEITLDFSRVQKNKTTKETKELIINEINCVSYVFMSVCTLAMKVAYYRLVP